jgi:hypothetical protein
MVVDIRHNCFWKTYYSLSILLLAVLLLPVMAKAQCLAGDCKNGTGKYDYGYAVYEGTFKDGLPHGKGTMDYGGGEKYVGTFVAGKEEGDGILYKKGTQQAVTYKGGVMLVRKEAAVVIGGNKVQYDGGMDCTGDCYEGHGRAKFPSGNVYSGSFKGGLFHGHGQMAFASGNVLEGEFINHVPVSGRFLYKDGTVFTGTFNKDGTPATGTYSNVETGGVVDVKNGTITKVSNPKLEAARSAQPQYTSSKCSMCNGAGFTTMTSTSYEQLSPNVYQASSTGYATLIRAGQSLKTSHTSQHKCPNCGGTGQIQVKK